MADSKIEVILNTPPIYQTSKNSYLSFGDLFKGHTNDLEETDTTDDHELDYLVPFLNQPYRDDLNKRLDLSPGISNDSLEFDGLTFCNLEASNGSPVFNGIAFEDLEPALTEEHVVNKMESKEPNVKRKRNVNDKKESVMKQTRSLQYPPCKVCGGKASGDHYGINSCEACKGFFRRYLLRKKGAYECKSGGHCEIIHTKKGMCAGCRLKKCLQLGMSKDKCKLGRYSAEKRTEKIQTVKAMNDDLNFTSTDFSNSNTSSPEIDHDMDIFTKTLADLKINDDTEESFTEDLIPVLIQAKNQMHPFGPNIDVNDHEKLKIEMRKYHEEYQRRLELYGEMKAVPKEDFVNLYKLYGIDVDNRLSDFRDGMEEIHLEVYEMCKFAKHIPYFSKLSIKDQSTLLKVNSIDAGIALCCHGYDPELQIVRDRKRSYHINDIDKIFSPELVLEWMRNCLSCQKLNLKESEQVLVMAFSLFFTDRCTLENPRLVEKIHLSLTQLLKQHLEKTCKGSPRSRFTKIIEFLTDSRKSAEMFNKELDMVCKDEIYGTEFPILSDFLIKDETSTPDSLN